MVSENVLFALLGALLGCLLEIATLNDVPKSKRPDFRELTYWAPFLVWIIAGGIITAAYEKSGTTLTPILSLNIGLSAPLTLRGMMAANPFGRRIDPGPGA